MPRRLKKLESNEAPVSRAESVPGPSPKSEKVAAKVREALRSHQESAEMDVDLDMLEKPSAPKRKAESEEVHVSKLEKMQDKATERFLEADKLNTESPSAENEAALEEARQAAERIRLHLEGMDRAKTVVEQGKVERQARQNREWTSQNAQGLAESTEKYNRAQAENAERQRIVAAARKSLEEYNSRRLEREVEDAGGIPVDVTVEEPITQRQLDSENPRLRSIMGKINKTEQAVANVAEQIKSLTNMAAEDAYEKLILNDRWVRIWRAASVLTNGAVYKALDEWTALSSKLESLKAELQEKRGMVDRDAREEEQQAAVAYRKSKGMPTIAEETTPVAEMDLDLDIMQGMKEAEEERALQRSINRGKRMAKPVKVEETEEEKIAKIEADYRANIVRDEQGGVIKSEKKIRAKRPESRVRISGGRSSDRPSATEAASSRAATLEPTEVAFEPRASEAEENLVRSYQEAQKDKIAEVRNEYPRAAEIWNSIQKRLISMDADTVISLRKLYGTIDVSTAYVLDRAFYDLNGDQEAKERLQEADKLLGIEDVSPKKQVRPKISKKAA